MSSKLKKYSLSFLGLIVLIILLLVFLFFQDKDKNLKVIFLDVGQGDSILIKKQNQEILIDGGPDTNVINKISKYLPFYDREIELVVLTHPHADHLIGLVEVLKRYKVKKVLLTKVKNGDPGYSEFLDLIENKKIPYDLAQEKLDYNLGENFDLDVLYPLESIEGQPFKELNDSSIIAKLNYKNTSFLFTGDASQEVEKELMAKNFDLKSEVLKVGHHGSKYSSSLDFLKAVNPKYAIIQSGKDNKFGHPHLIILRHLENLKIEILRNDEKGDIICEIGENMIFCQ
jgi:competence protein ComEC